MAREALRAFPRFQGHVAAAIIWNDLLSARVVDIDVRIAPAAAVKTPQRTKERHQLSEHGQRILVTRAGLRAHAQRADPSHHERRAERQYGPSPMLRRSGRHALPLALALASVSAVR